jgi:serine/threonine protein kinase
LENVLIDELFRIKIIDFGFSTNIKKDRKLQFQCGTPHYMSP